MRSASRSWPRSERRSSWLGCPPALALAVVGLPLRQRLVLRLRLRRVMTRRAVLVRRTMITRSMPPRSEVLRGLVVWGLSLWGRCLLCVWGVGVSLATDLLTLLGDCRPLWNLAAVALFGNWLSSQGVVKWQRDKTDSTPPQSITPKDNFTNTQKKATHHHQLCFQTAAQ